MEAYIDEDGRPTFICEYCNEEAERDISVLCDICGMSGCEACMSVGLCVGCRAHEDDIAEAFDDLDNTLDEDDEEDRSCDAASLDVESRS